VYCWGANDHGQLGVDDFDDRIVPTAVDGSQVYESVAVGAGHTCADSVGGAAVFCWGADSAGQLGDGPTVLGSSVPQRIPGLFAVRSLAVGSFHGCADSVGNGGVYCWGENQSGQLGVGPTAGSEIPLPIQPGHSLVRVTAGGQSTCALTAAGKAFCWGGNASGQLGVGDRATRVSPVPVASPIRFTALTVGFRHACGLTRRVAYCWGKNEQGQLGNGETDDALSPARVIGFRFQSVSAGGDHTCGITLRAEIYCWGRGDEGQLGLGAPVARATRPARVRHPL
jgi:alpha-tubulin suppressor-like RCC1 family protein